MKTIIEFDNVSYTWPGGQGLHDVRLTVPLGAFVRIVGPSGSGKSTLLRLASRLEEPSSGVIRFSGIPLGDYEPPLLRRRIGYIQQTPVVVAGSVRQNLLISYGFAANREQALPADDELRGWLDRLGLSGIELENKARSLSVGQRQRVCIIRSLLLEPDLLLMDEPTSALDIQISLWQLAGALGLVLVAEIASMAYELRLQKDLALGTLRTFAQLFAMGYLLQIIFRLNNVWLVLAVYLCMTFFSVRIIRGQVKERSIEFLAPTMVSVTISYTLVTYLVTGLIIGADPWWRPQYFIPIGGMVAGNSMNALAISLERFFSELRTRKDEVEMMLCLGADYREASRDMFRNALKAGMIPSINSMMGVGIVSIPGMMTGQILAGANPADAVRYQIVVMLMIVAATVLSALLVLHLVRRRCFGTAMNLLLRD